MFTGIVREIGSIVAVTGGDEGMRLEIEAPVTAPQVEVGGSVAINGVCLTAETVGATRLSFHAMPETLSRSALGELAEGARVNLEPALRAGDALGGHIVQGHVDGTAEILSRTPSEHWELVKIALPTELNRYLVAKGSITVDGISLTVVEAAEDWFSVSLIPTTLALTTLGIKQPGDPVNLEVDVIAKYVERLLGYAGTPSE